MFDRLGHLTYRRRRWVLALAGLFLAVGAGWGTGVFAEMVSSGFEDPDSESAKALTRVEQTVGRDEADVVVLYRADGAPVDTPAVWALEQDYTGPDGLIDTTWGPDGTGTVRVEAQSDARADRVHAEVVDSRGVVDAGVRRDEPGALARGDSARWPRERLGGGGGDQPVEQHHGAVRDPADGAREHRKTFESNGAESGRILACEVLRCQ